MLASRHAGAVIAEPRSLLTAEQLVCGAQITFDGMKIVNVVIRWGGQDRPGGKPAPQIRQSLASEGRPRPVIVGAVVR